MVGYILIDRDWIRHPIVGIGNPERHAVWNWMLAQARWKEGPVPIGFKIINLKRGQFVGSLRFISKGTGISIQKLRTFMRLLKINTMINTTTQQDETVITICKYNHYQEIDNYKNGRLTQKSTQCQHSANTVPTQNRTPDETPDETQTPAKRTGKEDYKPDYLEWYALYPKKAGKFEASKSYAKIIKSNVASHEDLIAGVKRYAGHIKAYKTEDKYIKGPAVWLNGRHWEDETEVKKRKSGW